MKKFSRIFLVGFRATGKSTLGKLLADKLNWSFMDLDFLITQQEGKDVAKITKNGTDWSRFREVENEALKEMSVLENVVISCGGGIGVNDIVDGKSKKTFGQLNQETLKNEENLIILLTSEDKIIKKRLTALFKRKKIMPFINKSNALKSNSEEDGERLVKKQVEDSMYALTKRKPLYKELADIEIDTSSFIFPEKLVNLNVVIGDPINHSLSPNMHNFGYIALGVYKDNLFIPVRVKNKNLKKFIEAVETLGINGISVTSPYKETIIKYLDGLEEDAKKIGAVNTIINEGGKLIGYNTDWIGAVVPLEKRTNLKGKKVAVLGAGGAAKAVVFGLTKKGAKVKIYNRTLRKAKLLADQYNCEFGSLSNLKEVKDMDIIINATSIGMNEDKSPLDKKYISKGQIVFDCVYSPLKTKLLKDAKSKGALVILGTEMLLYQAAEQFRLYTGVDAPVEAMRKFLLGKK